MVENVAGELHELTGSGVGMREEKQQFYSELIFIAQLRNYQSGWASHKYKEKFGVWPRGLDETPISPSLKTVNWIKHKNISWAKKQQRARQ
jgi:alpha-amylase/alpha-mannosidase (GH57 family)